MTFEMSINVFSRYILYLALSSSLSSFSFFEFSDIMPQIEEKIRNNIDKKRSDGEDGEMEIDNKIEDIHVYK